MQDVTDVVFRQIIAEASRPDVFFTEFTNTDSLFSAGRKITMRNFLFTEKQRPIVGQIWGTDPKRFYQTAQLIQELGLDGIDINMGCPAKAVIQHNSGSALINEPTLAAEIIQATKEGAGKLPVSVKTRIGFDQITTEDWISHLLKQKLAVLTIHGRVAVEMSEKPANWREISRGTQLRNRIAPETMIIGNGDVMSITDGQSKHQDYHVDGIMIARGIFNNPWVFDQNNVEHSTQEKLDLLLKHTTLFTQTWDTSGNKNSHAKPFDVMKKFFKIYASGFNGAAELRRELMTCNNLTEVTDIINNFTKKSIKFVQ